MGRGRTRLPSRWISGARAASFLAIWRRSRSRQKEIQYSSRTRAHTDQFKQYQRARHTLASLLSKLPADLLDSEEATTLGSIADHKVYKLVHLIHSSKQHEGHSKDYEFSRLSMEEHWRAGYFDAVRTLRHPEALQRPRQSGRGEHLRSCRGRAGIGACKRDT